MKYPVRARILDIAGEPVGGFIAATPAVSRPYIGEEGLAERIEGAVRITLDNGHVLWGWECWWEPLGAKVPKP